MDSIKTDKKSEPVATARDVIRFYIQGSKPYWYLPVLTTVCITISSVIQVIIPLFYKQFFDILSTAPNRPAAGLSLIHILVEILLYNALMWLVYRTASFSDNYYQSYVAAVLKRQAFEKLVGHSYTFFSNNFGGSLVQRVNRYIRAFGQLIDQVTWTILPLFINIVGIFIVLLRIKPLFAWMILGWTIVFLMFNFFFSRFKMKYDLVSATADSKTTAHLSDVITNHTSVQMFSGSGHESNEFQNLNWDQAKKSIFAWNLSGVVDAVQSSLIFVLEFFIFYFAVMYWKQGAFTVGTFVLLQAYAIGMGDRLWGFSRIIRTIYEGFANSKEMVDIMIQRPDIQDIPGAKNLVVRTGMIEYKDTVFSFNQNRLVLDHINLTIDAGEKIALIGPSGAGKSTFVRLLLRFYDTTSGSILIDGQNIHNVTLESLRNEISFVPQDPVLFHRTLKENIRYGRRDATDEEVFEAAKLAHCDKFIEDLPLKYETLVGERGIKLSGGERQRVAIARAILKNAPVLVLDEATSSLDSESEHYIQDALDSLMKDKTVIVIAHRLSTIRKMDRIIVIDNGRITEQGSHEQLLAKEESLYRKLWNLQAGGFLKETSEEQAE